MLNNEDILELETKRKIYNYVLEYPGLYLSELSRNLDIPRTTLTYHLHYLEKLNLITEKNGGRYTRFYATNNVSRSDKKLLNFMRQKTFRNIIFFLFKYPGSTRNDISKNLKKHPTTISYYLKKLKKMNIVEGIQKENKIRYLIDFNVELIVFLITYEKSLLEDDVGKVLNWVEDHIGDHGIDDLVDLYYEVFFV